LHMQHLLTIQSLTLSVSVQDGGIPPFTNTTSIAIRIFDVNEMPPALSPSNVYSCALQQTTPTGTQCVVLPASDPDLSRTALSYALVWTSAQLAAPVNYVSCHF
jgi:hypothetical protein